MQRFRESKLTKALQRGFIGLPPLRRRFRNSRQPTGGGGGGGSGSGGVAAATVNLSGLEDYNSLHPFINRIKSSSREWNDGTINLPENDSRLNADYEVAALPPGQTLTRYQHANLDAHLGSGLQFFKDGVYTLKWDGACVCDFLDSGTGQSTTGNVTTITLTQATLSFLRIRIRNLTGSNATATNLRWVHADHEALFASGEIFDPDFLTWVAKFPNNAALRFLDWQRGNFGTVTNPGDMANLSSLSWNHDDRGVPPEVIGELAKKTGKNIWTVMWAYATDATITSFYQRIKDRAVGWTGKFLSENPNETWNSQGFLSFGHLANGTYATTNSVVIRDENDTIITPGAGFSLDRLNSCYAHFAMRCWAAADAVFGSANVVPIGSTQTGNEFLLSQWMKWFQTGFQGGVRARDIMNARPSFVAMTNYFSVWSAENAAGRTSKQMVEQDYGSRSDAQWIADWTVHVDQHRDDYWLQNVQRFVALGYTGDFCMYEGGCHDFVDQQQNTTGGWSNFNGTIADAGTALDMGASGVSFLSDGDLIRMPYTQITLAVPSYAQELYARKIPATTKLRLYASQVLYDGDSGNTGVGAAALINGPHDVSNVTRHDRLATKIFTMMQGSAGLAIYTAIWERFTGVDLGKIKGIALYAVPGIMRLGNQRFTYCFDSIGRGVYAVTETPAMQYVIDQASGAAVAPTITSNGGGASASTNVAENTTAVTTVVATGTAPITYSISGADVARFAIGSSSGVLTFAVAPDFETPLDAGANNVYDVNVIATNAAGSDSQSIAVTVTAVNDNTPVITSNGGAGTASINVAENTTAVTTVTATDADAGSTLTYSITGGADAARFAIGSSSGVLTFIVAPDFEVPTDAGTNNTYEVIVQVSDGTNTDSQALSVTVTDVVPATVASVASASAIEGTSIAHAVVLSGAVSEITTLALSITGTTATGGGTDFTSALTNGNFNNGVTISGATLTVPASVSGFTVTVPTTPEATHEAWEQYTLTIGGQSGTGTIIDNDTLLEWGAATGSPTHYLVRWGTTTGTYPNELNVGLVTSVALSSLTPMAVDTTYFVAVFAVNGSGTSPASNEIQVRNGAYLNASVTAVSTASAQEGTSIVHTVTLSNAAGAPFTLALSISGVNATGGGTDFTSALVNGNFSNGVTISGATLTVPAAVSSFTVTVPTTVDATSEVWETYTLTVGGVSGTGRIIDDERSIAWDSVVGATSYTVEWGTATGVRPNTQAVGNVLSIPIISLSPAFAVNVTYFVAVTATDSVDTSPASNEIQVLNGAQI